MENQDTEVEPLVTVKRTQPAKLNKALTGTIKDDPNAVPSMVPLSNKRVIQEVIALKPGDKVEFRYGDYLENADAFNVYLEANVVIGSKLVLERDKCLNLIKELSISLRSGGLHALPMLCCGSDCDMYESCPLAQSVDGPPIGEPCPIERTMALSLVRRLQEDFNSTTSAVDELQIAGVTALQLYKTRVYAAMAKDAKPVVESFRGVDGRGRNVIEKIDNPAFRVLTQVHNMEQQLLKSLYLTNEQREKAKQSQVSTPDDSPEVAMRKTLAKLKQSRGVRTSLDAIDTTATVIPAGNGDEDFEVMHDDNGNVVKIKKTTVDLGPKEKKNAEQQPEVIDNTPVHDEDGTGASGKTASSGDQPSANAGDKSEGPGSVGEQKSTIRFTEQFRREHRGP